VGDPVKDVLRELVRDAGADAALLTAENLRRLLKRKKA
jgi:hypothetical protein